MIADKAPVGRQGAPNKFSKFAINDLYVVSLMNVVPAKTIFIHLCAGRQDT